MKVPWRETEWRRVAVYGLGASGLAASRLLRTREVEVLGIDMRMAEQLDLGDLGNDPGVEWILGSEPQDLPSRIDGVVVSPGVPPHRPLVVAARRAGAHGAKLTGAGRGGFVVAAVDEQSEQEVHLALRRSGAAQVLTLRGQGASPKCQS